MGHKYFSRLRLNIFLGGGLKPESPSSSSYSTGARVSRSGHGVGGGGGDGPAVFELPKKRLPLTRYRPATRVMSHNLGKTRIAVLNRDRFDRLFHWLLMGVP